MKKQLVIFFISFILLASITLYVQFTDDNIWAKGPSSSDIHLAGDFNGDGLIDSLRIDTQGDLYVSLFNGTTFSPETEWGSYKVSGSTKYYPGDFNGDHMTDLLLFDSSKGVIKAALTFQDSLTGDYSFREPEQWKMDLPKGVNNLYIGDFNGDGLDDILIYSDGWQVYTSNGNDFNPQKTWKGPESFNFDPGKVIISDFNGDGRSDISVIRDTCGNESNVPAVAFAQKDLTFSSFSCNPSAEVSGVKPGLNKIFTAGLNKIGKNNLSVTSSTTQPEKIVGVWFTNWYFRGCDLWADNKRDINKTPVAGWPDKQPSSGELYNSNNPKIVNLQIDAMIKAGINLIIVDYTNGWKNYNDPSKWEDDTVHAATNTLFSEMNKRRINNQPYIKIALGLGKEFWGPRSFKRLGWRWVGWKNQYWKQRTALDGIYSLYVKPYPEIYFNYSGHPLVVPFLWIGDDYPPKENGVNIPIWHYNDFTIKECVNWSSTFSKRAGPISGVTDVYINGMDTKRYWGWGAEKPQPDNPECMSVMPGTYNWPGYYKTHTKPAERLRDENGPGSYYIDSWKRIIEKNPAITLICDWNNWNEETAIEGCVGVNGWKDMNGNMTFDWYLKITRYYSAIFSKDSLITGVFLQQDGNSDVYRWNGQKLEKKDSDYKPYREPIIKLPENWLQNHNYWKF